MDRHVFLVASVCGQGLPWLAQLLGGFGLVAVGLVIAWAEKRARIDLGKFGLLATLIFLAAGLWTILSTG